MIRILAVVVGALSLVVSGFVLTQSISAMKQLALESHPSETTESPSHAAAAEEHGAGHGEAKAENSHGESSGGHGESSGGHGSGGGHGEPAREAASAASMVPFLSLEEVFANVSENETYRTLAVKIDVEFFELPDKEIFRARQSVVRHLVIQASREQAYQELATLSGKLYFKELLIRRMNEYFHKPLVKDVHFASFFLQ